MLEVEDLHVHYGAIPAVRGVSLVARAGDRVALVGRNGAGKTSTLRAIAGITSARRGRVRVAGHDVTGLRAARRLAYGVTLVPEGRGLFGDLTVRDNLVMGAYLSRRPPAALDDEIERVTERFPRIRERLHQEAGSLSGGEQQMLVVGRGLMSRPKVLLVDEPSLGLSPMLVDEMYSLFHELSSDGIAVVVVEQYVDVALRFARYAYVLDKGAVALEGPELAERGDIAAVYMASV